MKSNPRDERLLRRYLLGKLSSRKMDRLERRLLEDDELFELCEAIETDLLAASARGELASAERARVLRQLVSSPQGRERLALARSLNTVADSLSGAVPERPPRPSWRPAWVARTAFRPAFVALAAGLVAAIGVSLFLLQSSFTGGSESRVVRTRTATGAQITKDIHRSLEDHLPQKELVKAELMLSLTTLRSAGKVKEFPIPAGADIAVIQLGIEEWKGWKNLGSFHVAVRRKGGEMVWQGDLKPRQLDWGPVLELTIPAERLAAGRYEVTAAAGNENEKMSKGFKVVGGSRR